MSLDKATPGASYPEAPGSGATMDGMATHKRNLRHAAPGTGTAPRNYPWPLLLIAAPAAVAVWSGWVGLGSMCGFGPVNLLPGIGGGFHLNTAITLPVGIESYGAYALYVWIAVKGSEATRTFARRSAVGALSLGCLGQVAFHLLAAAGLVVAPWPVVVLVACLPVVTLSLAAALHHLVRTDVRTAEQAEAEARAARAEAERQRAERAEARAAAKAELPVPARTRNRKQPGTGTRKQAAVPEPEPAPAPEPAPEPEAEGVIDIDAEARILQLIAEGHSPSKAGVLAGKSDSYGRKVSRAAKDLTAAAPKGPDAEGGDS